MTVKETPDSRQERRRQQRQQEKARQQQVQQRQATRRRFTIIGAIVAVLVLLGAGGAYFAFANGNNNQTANSTDPLTVAPGGTIDGVQCQGNEMLNYHIHAHLTLYRNGQPAILPAYIGIPVNPQINSGGTNSTSCLYWLHVHDTSGVVHIESPTGRTYTLGQFLDVWQATANADAQGNQGITVDDSFVRALKTARPGAIHVYVGNKPVGAYRAITLTAHKLITIELGAPLKAPTMHYTFPNGE